MYLFALVLVCVHINLQVPYVVDWCKYPPALQEVTNPLISFLLHQQLLGLTLINHRYPCNSMVAYQTLFAIRINHAF